MKSQRLLFCTIFLAYGAVLQAADEQLAVSGDTAFTLNTTVAGGSAVVVSSSAVVSELPGVAYRAEETVTVTAPNGTETTLASGQQTDLGTASFTPTSGGIWAFANSSGETAKLIVTWNVFDEVDTAIVSSADYGAYLLDTVQTGPDREAKKGEIPPIAYSGDDWTGDLTAASTVTFTSPSGTATVWNKVGNGADTFTFNANGVWTVTLAFADGTTETAKLDITTGGTTVILR